MENPGAPNVFESETERRHFVQVQTQKSNGGNSQPLALVPRVFQARLTDVDCGNPGLRVPKRGLGRIPAGSTAGNQNLRRRGAFGRFIRAEPFQGLGIRFRRGNRNPPPDRVRPAFIVRRHGARNFICKIAAPQNRLPRAIRQIETSQNPTCGLALRRGNQIPFIVLKWPGASVQRGLCPEGITEPRILRYTPALYHPAAQPRQCPLYRQVSHGAFLQ